MSSSSSSSSSSSLQSTALVMTDLGFGGTTPTSSSSSSSSAAVDAVPDTGNRMMLVNTLLARITSTAVVVSDTEGVALARVFYAACADAGQLTLFQYALTLPNFQEWWWAAQKKNALADLYASIIVDDAAALAVALANMPSGLDGKQLRTSLAIECVRHRAMACWAVATREGTVTLTVSPPVANTYLDAVLAHDVPHRMLQDGLMRTIHAVRSKEMPLDEACMILRVVHVRAAIDPAQTVRMLNVLVDTQLTLLRMQPSAVAAAAGTPAMAATAATTNMSGDAGGTKEDTGRIRTRATSTMPTKKMKQRAVESDSDKDDDDDDDDDDNDIHKIAGVRAAIRRYFVRDASGSLTIDDIRTILQKEIGTSDTISGPAIGWAIRLVFGFKRTTTRPVTYSLRHVSGGTP